MESFLFKALELVAALSLLVLIHEFGHYIFARMFGIRVEKFYLFFNPWFSILRYDPRKNTVEIGPHTRNNQERALLTLKTGKEHPRQEGEKSSWRDTVYGLGWLPLGGYCKIAGMIDESMDKEQMAAPEQPWEFRSRPAWQRLLVMVGGVLFNFLLAIVIYTAIAFTWGEKTIKFRDAYAGFDFVPAAQEIGFRNGDIPLLADGQPVEATERDAALRLCEANTVTVLRNGRDTVNIAIPDDFIFRLNDDRGFYAYRLPVFVAGLPGGEPAIKAGVEIGDHIIAVGDSLTPSYTELNLALVAYASTPTTVTVERGSDRLVLPVTPTEGGKIGIQLAPITDIYPVTIVKYSLLGSIPKGIEIGTTTLGNYVNSMKHVFSKEGAQSLGGFGSIGSIFPEKWNWLSFWEITAFLSVALAFMNIIPIPALDGGHVMFLIYEVISRRKPSERFMEAAQYAGMIFLLLLLLYANGNDIYRFFLK